MELAFLRAVLRPSRDLLEASLSAIDATYGSPEGYLRDALKLDGRQLGALRERFVAA